MLTGTEAAAQQSDDLKSIFGFFTTFLLTFAGVSLFVGAFLIFNTFSILVAQRTRELALLRALGASRGQVTRSVLVEALAVGLFASVVGLASRRRASPTACGPWSTSSPGGRCPPAPCSSSPARWSSAWSSGSW